MSGQRSYRPWSPSSSSSSSSASASAAKGPLRAPKTFGSGCRPSDPASPSAASCDPGKRRSASSTVWTERLVSSGLAKEKKLIRSPVETIRRCVSFDTIAASSYYISGEWPRSNHPLIHLNLVHCPMVLTAEKWTQTVDDLEEQEVDGLVKQQLGHRSSDLFGVNCGHAVGGFREIRPRLSSSSSSGAPVSPSACCGCGSPVDRTVTGATVTAGSCNGIASSSSSSSSSSSLPRSRAITIAAISGSRNPLAPCQGSVEGFNQEIEKLVHNRGATDGYLDLSTTQAPTPDGHRAPIADLLNIRSVDTQTPSSGFYHSGIEKHFLRILEDGDDSPSLPIIPGAGENMSLLLNRPTSAGSDKSDPCERVISGCVSPASFIPLKTGEKREAPEGSEKVEVKSAKTCELPVKNEICHELPRPVDADNIFKCLIPSERSAFCPLFKKYVSQQALRSFSLSATEGDSSIEAK